MFYELSFRARHWQLVLFINVPTMLLACLFDQLRPKSQRYFNCICRFIAFSVRSTSRRLIHSGPLKTPQEGLSPKNTQGIIIRLSDPTISKDQWMEEAHLT